MDKNFTRFVFTVLLCAATISGFAASDHGRSSPQREDRRERTREWLRAPRGMDRESHSAFAGPNDSFHDTYNRNAGRMHEITIRPIANLHAKISAEENAAKVAAARAENRSSISVYSNIPEPKPRAGTVVAQTTIIQKHINISNSTVNIE